MTLNKQLAAKYIFFSLIYNFAFSRFNLSLKLYLRLKIISLLKLFFERKIGNNLINIFIFEIKNMIGQDKLIFK